MNRLKLLCPKFEQLTNPSRNQTLRSLPRLPVDKVGSQASHEREQIRLAEILSLLPSTKMLVSFVVRMNRENIRTPARDLHIRKMYMHIMSIQNYPCQLRI